MSEEEFESLRDEIMRLTYGDGYKLLVDQLSVYDRMFPCEDSDSWGTAFDYEIAGSEGEYLLWVFDEAERLADCARSEKNVRLISAHARYNVLCAWYNDMYVNGTEDDRAYYSSLRDELKDILLESGATYISFIREPDTEIRNIDFTKDPYTWLKYR